MTSSVGSASESRLGVLDGLRGIAVLLVLWYHLWEISWLGTPAWLAFVPATGFVGVSLFFFLSGFVISHPFVRAEALGAPTPSWQNFAWRRFIKIVPSYLLCIAFAYGVGYAQLQPGASTLPDIVTHVLFVHTWFPARFGTIEGVLWTLAVEVEFYCCFPLIWACLRRQPWWTAGTMIAIAWLWRADLAQCCYAAGFAQYEENLPGYLDLFAFGMIGAWLFVNPGRIAGSAERARWFGPLCAVAGTALLVALLENLYSTRLRDQWQSVWQINGRSLLGLSFAMIALGALRSPRSWQAILDNPPLRFLATISYNLYLYHQLLGRELLWHHVPQYAGDPHRDPWWQRQFMAVATAVTIAQAAVVTYGFERPLLQLKRPARGRHRSTRVGT
ncbi:MAG: acyltransferase [Candidatus Eremiobacteraeota bacterium]|nr:acyltransferase [Candidatus Eremiobacteraeota bacterium]MBV9055796.1 acyltransferase [Candidatus Eremiobacteraeota bacterium]MBV9699369.1 acyltransferase [Candidatus Eremiobacteraeota bacterium]